MVRITELCLNLDVRFFHLEAGGTIMKKEINPTQLSKRRLIFLFLIFSLLCTGLAFRIGWIQVVAMERYARLATEQQTRDMPIPAKRGVIFDRNSKELAISAVKNTIWARPADVASARTDEESQQQVSATAAKLSELLSIDSATVQELITRERSIVKLAKYIDKEVADQIREARLPGISITEDVKRYYPLGSFAAHLLGSTTDDNNGLSGIELRYDKYLAGRPGRSIANTDVTGDSLAFGIEKYFQAEDGLSVMLTIDEVIQHYVEKAILEVQQTTSSKRVFCLIMDPSTGEVLAIASTPEFDPNDPRTPPDPEQAELLQSMTDAEKMDFWNEMWRNPMINDTYEPGSTFKLITTAIALEEKVTNPLETFTCTGSIHIAGSTLNCWRSYNPHGLQTVTEAVQNSCNPVFVQISQRLGLETYYHYLNQFGLMEKTGIDFPGEAGNLLQNKDTAGPVGLATMSYGQGIAVTPISLMTAVSALGNEGMMMQPRLVKALLDAEGNVVREFDPVEVRQVISRQTAEEMSLIMESVVAEGGGGTAKIPGYRIGGKTGTANKVENGVYIDDTYSSFIGMAPMDDPKVAILLVVDSPQGVKFGSLTAAPGAKTILENTLRYLNVEKKYSDEERDLLENDMVSVPSVTGESFSDAIGILGGVELNYVIAPDTQTDEDFTIIDQYPKPGEKAEKGSSVYLYWK
ncbi:MAG: stage V sporulation protein D [Firmicutes bacterium HGW-Firmicutes-11]|jgi:stage V sporulation protein D (sporulation-specific penicillin-binding protein)|nr:MAG: stage V sporulation protein D [Firmicutes bacterium HGW-Firmicutes-11]